MARDIKKDFGGRLRELREKEGLTQAQLAKILNISRAALGYYENAERTPDIETLDLAAAHFKVTTDYLLGRTPNKTTNPELQAVCEYTGLSEGEIEDIRIITKSSEELANILSDFCFSLVRRFHLSSKRSEKKDTNRS